jgi:hypothetical protein
MFPFRILVESLEVFRTAKVHHSVLLFEASDHVAIGSNWHALEQPIRQFRRELSIGLDEFGDMESKKASTWIVDPPHELLALSAEIVVVRRRDGELIPTEA